MTRINEWGQVTLAEIPSTVKTIFAIGDIHGCADALALALEHICTSIGTTFDESKMVERLREINGAIVFLGDYVDRGPSSYTVVSSLLDMAKEHSDCIFLIRGNHEELMIGADRGGVYHGSSMWGTWFHNGGNQTLKSYQQVADLSGADAHELIRKHIKEIDDVCEYGYRAKNLILVHAGVDPCSEYDEQTVEDVTWIRWPFLQYDEPFFGNVDLIVVHGHSPVSEKPTITPYRVNLDTGYVFGWSLSVGRFDLDDTTNKFGLTNVASFPNPALSES